MTVTSPPETNEVITIRNAFKSYNKLFGKSIPVLQGLDLTVSHGTIYGLLGPSGCGKTTLLRCTLGCMPLDRGSIHVFGHYPGTKKSGVPGVRVGFMPQDDALMDHFTIAENFQYYGWVTQMTNTDVVNRARFLSKLLHLPANNRLIGQLSGGQKKRVSFATALLHSPELLILDEPTVGVDPILRQRIWDYLFSLVNAGKTSVIITTHYIEEARKSNMVGLMIEGRLLAESEPEVLISKVGCSTLEEAFLQLCYSTSSKNNTEQVHSMVPLNGNGMPISHSTVSQWTYRESDSETDSNNDNANCKETKDVWFHLRQTCRELSQTLVMPKPIRLKATFVKTYLRIKNDYVVLLFELLLPALLVTLFCPTFGKLPREIPLSIVNEDVGSLGQEFTSYIDSTFISQMPTNNYSLAYKDVLDGYSIGIVHIQPNFSDAILKRYQLAVLTPNDTINDGMIALSLDLTKYYSAISVYHQILKTFDTFANQTLQDFGIDRLLTNIPVVFHEPIYGRKQEEFTSAFLPGVFVCLMYFFLMGETVFYFIMDRKNGIIEREIISGLSAFEVCLGHLLFSIVMSIVQVASTICIFYYIFHIPCEGSLFLVFLFGLGQGICGTLHGMFVSGVCDKENTAIMFSLGTVLLTAVLSGVFWPFEGIHPLLQFFSRILIPQTPVVEAVRAIFGRGWTLAHYPVYIGALANIGWVLFFLIASSFIYRLKA